MAIGSTSPSGGATLKVLLILTIVRPCLRSLSSIRLVSEGLTIVRRFMTRTRFPLVVVGSAILFRQAHRSYLSMPCGFPETFQRTRRTNKNKASGMKNSARVRLSPGEPSNPIRPPIVATKKLAIRYRCGGARGRMTMLSPLHAENSGSRARASRTDTEKKTSQKDR